MQKPQHVIEGLRAMAATAIRSRWERCSFHIQPEGATEPHKRCTKCLNCLPISAFSNKASGKFGVASWCKKCAQIWKNEFRKKDPETLERHRSYARKYWNEPERRKKFNALQIKRHHELRRNALDAYGGKCACCQESRIEFLAIDHVDPKSKKCRTECGTKLYRMVKKLGYPPEFQILCHNCNMAKGFYGECPHQKEKITCQKH